MRLPLFVALALFVSPATAAEPDVATVHDWLDQQLYLLAPGGGAQLAFETEGEPTVAAVGDGVEARLPGATLWYGDVLLVLGDLTLDVTAGEGDRLQVDVDLPERIPVTEPTGGVLGELALRQPGLSGSLDPARGVFVDGAVTAGATAFSLSSGLAWLETGAVDLRWTAEPVAERRRTVDETLAIAGLSAGTTAGYGVELSALTTEGCYVGFDLESYLAFLDVGADPLALDPHVGADARSIGVLADFVEHVGLDSLYERIRATETIVTLPASGDVAIAALDLTGTTTRLNGSGTFDLDYRYDVQGIALEGDGLTAALSPRDADVTLRVSRLPVVGLLRATEAYVAAVEEDPAAEGPAAATLAVEIRRLLRDADTEARLVDSRFDGPLLTARFDGYARPDASQQGATALLTVEVAGFAATQRRLGELEASVSILQIAAALAVIELNGTPIGELLALLMPQR